MSNVGNWPRGGRVAWVWPVAVACSLALGACGGGGGGGGGSTAPPANVVPEPVPVVDVTGPGELKAAAYIGRTAAVDVAGALQAAQSKVPGTLSSLAPRYDVDSYRINYLTVDGLGKPIVASGLLSLPVKAPGAPSPVISYQHGTTFKDAEAPSNNVVPAEPPLVLASLGAIVLAADYVGYGASKGAQHPYLLSAPAAAAVVDLITAAQTWRRKSAVADNGQLFLVGYSEGGYATMAAHRALQASASPHLAQLVGAITGAGPYHVGATMDAMLERVRRENRLLGALVDPGFLGHLGGTLRDEVRRNLVKLVMPDDADVAFQPTFIDNFLADDNTAIERDSNVHDWLPAAPIRLYHGRDDATVPYASSTRTLQAMQARGAGNVALADCTAAPSSHLGCVPPFFAFVLTQLAPVIRNL
jgi:pimeloyl-ACP methyl ester carboxylesterase